MTMLASQLGLIRQKGFEELLLEYEQDKPRLQLPERIFLAEEEVAGIGRSLTESLNAQSNRVQHRVDHESNVVRVAGSTGMERGHVDAMMTPTQPPSMPPRPPKPPKAAPQGPNKAQNLNKIER